MESVKAFKFMNGWIVKHKDIDEIKEAIWANRATALEELYVYGWAVKVEMDSDLNYKKAIEQFHCACEDAFIKKIHGFAIMKAGTKYLVLDISMLCETEEFGIVSGDYRKLYDLL